jgi:hypothetical protein
MIDYKDFEARIKNCSSEKELLIIEDEVYELSEKHPEIDSDRLHLLIADRRKYLQEHTCNPWKTRRQKKL